MTSAVHLGPGLVPAAAPIALASALDPYQDQAPFTPALERLLERYARTVSCSRLLLTDRLTRCWLRASSSPFAGEIEALAARIGCPGVLTLNLAYEWACTTANAGGTMLRTLDWNGDGLGELCIVAARRTLAGAEWLSIGWPGYAGELTVLAPGRFAVAMNQAPYAKLGYRSWFSDMADLARSRALPPSHLLRRVAAEAETFADAVEMLARTPMCRPAIFIVQGLKESAVVERLPRDGEKFPSRRCAANHWHTPRFRGVDTGETRLRERCLAEEAPSPGAPLAWLKPPVLNERTKYAAELNPRTGVLFARAYEASVPFGDGAWFALAQRRA